MLQSSTGECSVIREIFLPASPQKVDCLLLLAATSTSLHASARQETVKHKVGKDILHISPSYIIAPVCRSSSSLEYLNLPLLPHPGRLPLLLIRDIHILQIIFKAFGIIITSFSLHLFVLLQLWHYHPVIMDPSPPTAAESSPEDLSPPKTASPKPASPEPSLRETPSSKPSSQESSSQEALPTPPKTPPPSVHGPKSATPKCFKCKSLDILPVRTLFRMSEGAEPGRKELLSVFIQGAGLYDIPLCSVCFMRAKGCSAFRWRLRSCKAFWRSTEMDAAAILYEEHTWRFDTELVRHGQRMKDADELIDYVRRLDKPSVENRRAPESPDEQEIRDRMPDFDLTSHLRYDGSETTLTFDGIANTHEEHRQRLIGERDPQPSLRSLWEYPVQITDLIALKEASERYIVALGRTADASEQWRSMRQLLNKLADDFMRLPPIMHSEAPAATNAAVSDPTPVYCEICQWCRDCLAEL